MICSSFNVTRFTAHPVDYFRDSQMTSDEEALAWASNRKRGNETVIIAHCPVCTSQLAVYVQQTARQEIVPDTSPPSPEPETAMYDR
jgi:hypothetical protein